MKVAPLLAELERRGWDASLVHTGQHYDETMSGSFFADLGLRDPDVNLHVGSGTHAVQTAQVMVRFSEWLESTPIDVIAVVGDVNSTVACTLVGAKLGIPIAHVEAGLRSFDRTMPEEINRLATDVLSTWLLTPSADADDNLVREGVHPGRIFQVGNIMVDSLEAAVKRRPAHSIADLSGVKGEYGLVTLHRPALVDDPDALAAVIGALGDVAERTIPLVFPVHPRTRSRIDAAELEVSHRLTLIEPLGYLDFVHAQAGARLVLTDSGGVQEETTCLGVPCLTLRTSTERPITVTHGTNRVIGVDPTAIEPAVERALAQPPPDRRPPLWDGQTARRVVDAIESPVPAAAWCPPAG